VSATHRRRRATSGESGRWSRASAEDELTRDLEWFSSHGLRLAVTAAARGRAYCAIA